MVALDAGLPMQDMKPGGLVSPLDMRSYATREARYRLHQQRFKLDVMRAYRRTRDRPRRRTEKSNPGALHRPADLRPAWHRSG